MNTTDFYRFNEFIGYPVIIQIKGSFSPLRCYWGPQAAYAHNQNLIESMVLDEDRLAKDLIMLQNRWE